MRINLPSLRGRVNIDIAATLARQVMSGILQLGLVLIVSYEIGPEGAGQFSLGLLLPTIMSQLFAFGLSSSLVYFTASGQFTAQVAWSASRDIIGIIALAGTALGAVSVIILKEVLFPGVQGLVLYLALFAFPFMLYLNLALAVLQAHGDFRAFNVAILLQSGVAILLFLSAMLISTTSAPLFILLVVVSFLPAVLYASVSVSRHVRLFARSDVPGTYLKPAFSYGLTAYAGNLVTFLNYRIDLLLVNALAGTTAAGIYAVAVRFVEQLWVLSSAYVVVVFPKMASMKEDEGARLDYTAAMARSVLWLTLAAALLLYLVASWAIFTLYSGAFDTAVGVIHLLLPGVVAMSFARVLAHDVAARGLISINLFIALASLATSVLAAFLLIPQFGVLGAAAATSGSYLFASLIHITIQATKFRMQLGRLVFPARRLRGSGGADP